VHFFLFIALVAAIYVFLYTFFYSNDPRPSDLDDTDTILATSLVITYKRRRWPEKRPV
jgi:hypothetical protein